MVLQKNYFNFIMEENQKLHAVEHPIAFMAQYDAIFFSIFLFVHNITYEFYADSEYRLSTENIIS